jgi:uncharacterized membrane protein YeaQ/YmgE (transglycosylase-associated protein family)
MMNIVLWLLFGVLAGLVVSRLSSRLLADNIIINSVAGVLGALVAGLVFLIFDVTPLSTINIWGIIIALAGALVGISLAHIFVRRLI